MHSTRIFLKIMTDKRNGSISISVKKKTTIYLSTKERGEYLDQREQQINGRLLTKWSSSVLIYRRGTGKVSSCRNSEGCFCD